MKPLIEVISLGKMNDEGKEVLSPVSFVANQYENLAIMGETGSSKSTLLRLIAGLLEPDLGEVRFDGQKILGPSRKLVPGHKDMRYMSQYFELPKFITVREYLERIGDVHVDEVERVYEACDIVSLLERKTIELSGGERQRVALTKELLRAPKLLLLDEPFSNLDVIHKRSVKEALVRVKEELDLTIFLVAHDPYDVLDWADNIIVMKEGKLVQRGTPKELYTKPANAYVAGLLGNYSVIDVDHLDLKGRENFFMLDGQAMIRPHQIILDEKGSYGGEITSVNYYGSHYEIHIKFSNTKLIAFALEGVYKVGGIIRFNTNFIT